MHQDGDYNEAKVIQVAADLSASYIYQGGDGHMADVYQEGRNNVSTIRQNVSYGGAAAAIHSQVGHNNSAISTQW